MTESPVVLITGAGGGLGQGLVSEFSSQGWRVAAAFHRTTAQSASDRVWPVALDLTRGEQPHAVVKQILARWGRIDALINNAGITADSLVARMTGADWDRVLQVNLKGAFLCSKAVLPAMLKQRNGHIIQVGSFAARRGTAGQANYAAAKAGLLGLSASLAQEVGSRNVRVNAVLPGVLRTAMTAKLTPTQLAEITAANALGRINSVPETARFILFLTTTLNISGQVFQLDSRIGRWT